MKNYNLSSEYFIYTMSKDNKPAITVESESRITFETNDCFHGQLVSESQGIDYLDWSKINPATGPVYVENAKVGDLLKINIEKIELTGKGILAAVPNVGIFGNEIEKSSIKILDVINNEIKFNEEITLPVVPMIGVIGTAAEKGDVSCGTPGFHGGNMDCKLITENTTVYLPVFHDGGLLGLGDVHALMGDGEIMGTGVEIPAKITVTIELLKDKNITRPIIETKNSFFAVGSEETLENASLDAITTIRNILMTQKNMNLETAGMLLSAVGNLEVCQIVNPKVTVRYEISKKYLKSIF